MTTDTFDLDRAIAAMSLWVDAHIPADRATREHNLMLDFFLAADDRRYWEERGWEAVHRCALDWDNELRGDA